MARDGVRWCAMAQDLLKNQLRLDLCIVNYLSTSYIYLYLPHQHGLLLTQALGGPRRHPSAATGSHPNVDSEGSDIGYHHDRGHCQVPGKA